MGTGFFPLDKQLGLGSVALMPHAHQAVVRLGACLPFREVAEHLETMLGLHLSPATIGRQTEQAGRGELAVQQEQAEPLAPCPEEEVGECLVMSGDGAFVPLVHGQWGEVKHLAVGHVQSQTDQTAGQQVHTTHLSYFARLADAASFSDQASSEVRRRGIDRAKVVVAVQDGAEWLQGLVQAHRADAVRILDFAHAAQRVAAIGEQLRLRGEVLPDDWLDTLLHRLKHEGATVVLESLHDCSRRLGTPEEIEEHVRYLCKRTAQMDYPSFQKQGYPIGSGIVESGNKLVMQARLKGAGMHWHPRNVNPMLALRMALCNHRWQEGWQDQQRWHHQQRETQQRQRHRERYQAKLQEAAGPPPVAPAHSEPPRRPASGRTDAQKRWGRQTFSPRLLRQGASAKI